MWPLDVIRLAFGDAMEADRSREGAVRGQSYVGSDIVGQIASDLLSRFSDAQAELFLKLCDSEKVQQFNAPLKDVLPIFEYFCGCYSGALVRYEPDHPYGIVSTVWCQCKPSEEAEKNDRTLDQRCRAMLVLTRVGIQEVLVGSSTLKPNIPQWESPEHYLRPTAQH